MFPPDWCVGLRKPREWEKLPDDSAVLSEKRDGEARGGVVQMVQACGDGAMVLLPPR